MTWGHELSFSSHYYPLLSYPRLALTIMHTSSRHFNNCLLINIRLFDDFWIGLWKRYGKLLSSVRVRSESARARAHVSWARNSGGNEKGKRKGAVSAGSKPFPLSPSHALSCSRSARRRGERRNWKGKGANEKEKGTIKRKEGQLKNLPTKLKDFFDNYIRIIAIML